MTIRTIIVDDEPLARDGIRIALEQEADVEIIAECADGGAAIRAIRDLRPDLVFLDIKMPGLSGFDVVESVGITDMPAVIFLTAYEEHALRAFRVNAVDYLLKPVDDSVLRESVARVRRKIADVDSARRGQRLRSLLAEMGQLDAAGADASANRIVVRSVGHVHFLRPHEITWVEASGDYVSIHTADEAHLIRDSMKNMEERLAPYGFQRIHRSSLVNLECIRELVANERGDYEVVLSDGTVCRLSRAYRDALCASLRAAPGLP